MIKMETSKQKRKTNNCRNRPCKVQTCICILLIQGDEILLKSLLLYLKKTLKTVNVSQRFYLT